MDFSNLSNLIIYTKERYYVAIFENFVTYTKERAFIAICQTSTRTLKKEDL